ncbi:MAG: alpha-glucan family phosphorylase, partial [Planctomycetota bacterium]
MEETRRIAYFSMEIGLEAGIPTYSGGLGVLAGDTIRSAADLQVPMVAVTLLDRKGYFHQRLDASGWQVEEPEAWVVENFLSELPARAAIQIEGRNVAVRAYRYDVLGLSGGAVPVLFLDTDLPENDERDRALTHTLYGGDLRYRLAQEVVLGVGGVRVLRALGYKAIERFHMNEGHAALLALELLDEHRLAAGRKAATPEDAEAVRKLCVFTTHTPVPAGHDKFPLDLVKSVLGPRPEFETLKSDFCCDGTLNLTHLASSLSHYLNGVAKRHGEVATQIFTGYAVDSITNGVHLATWASPPFQALFDRYIPGWRQDNFSLRYAAAIPLADIRKAHAEAKDALLKFANWRYNAGLDKNALTIGFARRAATYKRADLLFQDPDRLRAIAQKIGPIQCVFAGKAHPQDKPGKELIQRVVRAKDTLREALRIVYVEDYDFDLGRLITSGVDVWLNTPRPPMEASGTSGMKAALNGVPSLSILDGWWVEGCLEGITGWAIGDPLPLGAPPREAADDATLLYDKMEKVVLPLFYQSPARFAEVMRSAIAFNASFF